MKTILFLCLMFCAVEIYAANPTFQTFDTNAFIVNQSGNSIGANTSGGNPNALVKQSQITAGGISLSEASNVVNGAGGVIKTNGAGTTFWFSDSGSNVIQQIAGGGITNTALTATTDVEADANKRLSSLGNGTGVKTNNNAGAVGWNSAFTGTWIAPATLPASAADSTWMPLTNAVAFTNGPPIPGQAVVIAGAGTNSFGAVLVRGTNWPSGGGSAFPLAADANANGFSITNMWEAMWFTNDSGTKLAFNLRPDFSQSLPAMLLEPSPLAGALYAGLKANFLYVQGNGNGGLFEAAIIVTNNGVNTTITSNNIVTGFGTFNGGSVSVIPTNAAPVYTSNGLTGALPFGLTNTLQGRCQYLVGYYIVDAVGGTPILTVSNEMAGYKYPPISLGASASITPGTNWFTTPILSTNTVLRIRDESAGSGASVGIISSKQIGL